MTRLRRKSTALLVFLTSVLAVQAQSLEDTYLLGNTLFDAGNYSQALKLYNRVVFFDAEKKFAAESYRNMAVCYEQLADLEKALKAYDMAVASSSSKAFQNEVLLQKSLYLVVNKKWFAAQQELYSLKLLKGEKLRLRNYLLASALYGSNSFEQSMKYFLRVAPKEDSAAICEVFATIDKKLNPKRISRARSISYFIPGSGQFLAGNVKGGINSMLLVGGLGALYFSTAKNYGLLSALITVFPWFSRYHIGGAENAEESMMNRQQKLKNRYFNQLIDLAAG